MEQKYKDLISYLYKDGLSVAAITSLLYLKGYKPKGHGRYQETFKNVEKEIQRIESKKLKSYRSLKKKAEDAKEKKDYLKSISLFKKALTFRNDDEKYILEMIKKLEEFLFQEYNKKIFKSEIEINEKIITIELDKDHKRSVTFIDEKCKDKTQITIPSEKGTTIYNFDDVNSLFIHKGDEIKIFYNGDEIIRV